MERRKNQLVGQRERLILERTIMNDQKSAKMISLLEEYRHDNPTTMDRIDNESSAMSIRPIIGPSWSQ